MIPSPWLTHGRPTDLPLLPPNQDPLLYLARLCGAFFFTLFLCVLFVYQRTKSQECAAATAGHTSAPRSQSLPRPRRMMAPPSPQA